jgi:hypothetical protein
MHKMVLCEKALNADEMAICASGAHSRGDHQRIGYFPVGAITPVGEFSADEPAGSAAPPVK